MVRVISLSGFQQPLGGGLSRPAFGIARKQSRDFLARLRQSMTNHALQNAHNPQGDGKAGT